MLHTNAIKRETFDIAFLSTKLSLSDMLKAYQQKYKNSNPIRPLKGLTYFEDILSLDIPRNSV